MRLAHGDWPSGGSTTQIAYETGPRQVEMAGALGFEAGTRNADPTLVFLQGKIPAIGYTDPGRELQVPRDSAGGFKPLELFFCMKDLFARAAAWLRRSAPASPHFTKLRLPETARSGCSRRYFTESIRAQFQRERDVVQGQNSPLPVGTCTAPLGSAELRYRRSALSPQRTGPLLQTSKARSMSRTLMRISSASGCRRPSISSPLPCLLWAGARRRRHGRAEE